MAAGSERLSDVQTMPSPCLQPSTSSSVVQYGPDSHRFHTHLPCISIFRDYYEPRGVEGFHPAKAGDIFNQRYKAVHLLGSGYSSNAWLADDFRCVDYCVESLSLTFECSSRTNQRVAVKILVPSFSNATKRDAARDELGILRILRDKNPSARGWKHICHLLDDFKFEGPNGRHVCLVLESLGVSALDLHDGFGIAQSFMPLNLLKRITKHALEALEYIHSCGVVHTGKSLPQLCFSMLKRTLMPI